jgi:hypothetical protein
MNACVSVRSFIITASFALLLVSCLSVPKNDREIDKAVVSAEKNLRQFGYVNCLYWYFDKKGYDTKDLRSIAGAIVELGYSSADKYRRLASFMREYRPHMTTKSEIDVDLFKCFKFDESAEFNRLIESLK